MKPNTDTLDEVAYKYVGKRKTKKCEDFETELRLASKDSTKKKNSFFCIIILLLIFANSCEQDKKDDNSYEQNKESFILPENAIKVIYDSHFYIPAALNDSISGDFLFDTGADMLYLDSVYSSKLAWQKFGKARMNGTGNSYRLDVELIMDTVIFKATPFIYQSTITPIIGLRQLLGRKADGLIGMHTVIDTIIEFNYENEYIRFLNSRNQINMDEYRQIPMKKKDGRYYLNLTVKFDNDICVNGDFAIDLGSGGTLDINNATMKKYKLDEMNVPKVKYTSNFGGIGGSSSSIMLRSNYIILGNDTLKNVPVDCSLNTKGALSINEKHIGLIGNEIFERYDVIFDFPQKIMYLKPNKSYGKKFSTSKVGFSYTDRTDICDYWLVNRFYEAQNAEKSGLLPTDSISHVNGRAVTSITWEEQRNHILTEKNPLVLTVKRGDKSKEISIDISKEILP